MRPGELATVGGADLDFEEDDVSAAAPDACLRDQVLADGSIGVVNVEVDRDEAARWTIETLDTMSSARSGSIGMKSFAFIESPRRRAVPFRPRST